MWFGEDGRSHSLWTWRPERHLSDAARGKLWSMPAETIQRDLHELNAVLLRMVDERATEAQRRFPDGIDVSVESRYADRSLPSEHRFPFDGDNLVVAIQEWVAALPWRWRFEAVIAVTEAIWNLVEERDRVQDEAGVEPR